MSAFLVWTGLQAHDLSPVSLEILTRFTSLGLTVLRIGRDSRTGGLIGPLFRLEGPPLVSFTSVVTAGCSLGIDTSSGISSSCFLLTSSF